MGLEDFSSPALLVLTLIQCFTHKSENNAFENSNDI